MSLSQRRSRSARGDVNKMTQNKIDPDPEHNEFQVQKESMMKTPDPDPPLTGCAAERIAPL